MSREKGKGQVVSEVAMREEEEAANHFWGMREESTGTQGFKIIAWSLKGVKSATGHLCEEKEGN